MGVTVGGIGGPNNTIVSQLEGFNLTVCMHYLLLSSNPEAEPALATFFGTITTQSGLAIGEWCTSCTMHVHVLYRYMYMYISLYVISHSRNITLCAQNINIIVCKYIIVLS